VALAVTVEDPVLTPVVSALNEVDLSPGQRMEWVRDSDGRDHPTLKKIGPPRHTTPVIIEGWARAKAQNA
jgi:hypothetical protein